MKNNVELLSPVGSYESLLASIENGADAVYLGGKLFNARKYASNFDYDELKSAVDYAHVRGVKVYVVVNIILRDDELKEAVDYLIYLYNIDVDALIIQDLGLLRLVKKLLPDFEVHGSTQMSINNYYGALLLQELGFSRVVLARELSIREISEISKKTDIELEIFVHGALCVSYSGQCLMSSLIGGRSGNRGTCAQPCRMKYTIVDTVSNKSLNKGFDEKHILSLKDLNAIDDLEEIIDAGVVSLKIEGRMKKPEYVATIIGQYRKKLDRLEQDDDSETSVEDKEKMAQMFNRGFTKGFLKEDFGRDIVTLDKPNNRGVLIGEVTKINNESTHILLDGTLVKGDGIEIITKSGEGSGLIIDRIDQSKNIAVIKNVRGASVGDKVYKTLDIELNKSARESFVNASDDTKHLLDMEIDIKIGKPVILKVIDGKKEAVVYSKEIVEQARNISLTEERVHEQMEKLGNTPYILGDIDISIEDGSMIRVSVLNNLRRLAVEELAKDRSNFNNRTEVKLGQLSKEIKDLFAFPKNKIDKKKISIKVDTLEKFKQLNLNKLDRIYLNFKSDIKKAISMIKEKNNQIEIYVSTEKIIENNDFIKLKSFLNSIIEDIDGVSVSNLGTLAFVKDNFKTKIHSDFELNVFNSQAAEVFKELGVTSATLSAELKLNQLEKISRNDILEYEVVGYGYLPLMTLKHCPMAVIKNCKSTDNCETCEMREGYGLLDRKDMIFDFKRAENSTIVYNSQPIVVAEYLKQIYQNNIDMVRLDFTKEENVAYIQAIYYDFANDIITLSEVESRVDKLKTKEGITKGHFFRGVL